MNLPLPEHRRLLGTYLGTQGQRVVLLAVLLLTGIGLQLLNPQVIRYFIDTAQAGGSLQALLLAALAYLAIGLLGRGLALATSYEGLNVAWTATNALRGDLVRHCLRLDMPFHKTHTPGELIERIDGDATELGEFFSQMAVKATGNALLVVAVLALLFRENAAAGLILTAYTALTVTALAALQNLGARRWAAARQAWSDQSSFLEEHIAGSEDIRGVGAEGYVLGKLLDLMHNLLEQARGGWMANALGFAVTNFLYIVGYGLGLAIGAYLYTRGSVTIGTAFVIVYYIGMLAAPLDEIRNQAKELQQATASIDRVTELFRKQPEVVEQPSAELPGGALEVAFTHVSFAYADPGATGGEDGDSGETERAAARGLPVGRTAPDTPHAAPSARALHDITFTVPAGRILGVLGRTGSGKTTLTRLLFRLYDPTEGAIRLTGTDLRDVALPDLRRRVGMVTQDVQLFGASVRDNITLFDPAVTDDQIRRALAELELLDWVEALPGGLEARLAASGGGMSAGEAQLLAFTRLMLRDPGLVILDEAASRLDPVTESRLERAIDRLVGKDAVPSPRPPGGDGSQTGGATDSSEAGGPGVSASRTAIIIAHRLHTVQRADDILILEGGRVVEYGPRERLAADSHSHFYSLLQTGLEEALA